LMAGYMRPGVRGDPQPHQILDAHHICRHLPSKPCDTSVKHCQHLATFYPKRNGWSYIHVTTSHIDPRHAARTILRAAAAGGRLKNMQTRDITVRRMDPCVLPLAGRALLRELQSAFQGIAARRAPRAAGIGLSIARK
jgi:hypothetical protein